MTGYLVVAVVSASAAAGLAWKVLTAEHREQMAQIRVQHTQAMMDAAEAAKMETIRLQELVDEAVAQSQKRQKALARDADNARRELVRLQDAARSAASRSADTCPAAADDTAAISWVLGKCAAELQDVAAKADGHANDVRTLIRAWPKPE